MADEQTAPETKGEVKAESTPEPKGNRNLSPRTSFEDRMARASKKSNPEAVKAEESPIEVKEETGEESKPTKTKSKDEVVGTVEDRMAAAAAALEAGDLKALAKALGKDAKMVDVSTEKYSVLRKKAQKLEKVEAHWKSEGERIVQLGREMKEQFGDPRASQKAYKRGDYRAAAQALQKWFGDDFGTITRNIAKETAGLSPEEKALLEKKAELDEREAKMLAEQAKAKKNQTAAQQRENAVKVISAKCAGHDVLKMKNGAELVLVEMENAYDPDLQASRLTFKQACDAVLERKLEEAAALGLPVDSLRGNKAAPKAAPKVTTAPPARVHTEPSSSGKPQRRSFEERMEAARRITERSRSK